MPRSDAPKCYSAPRSQIRAWGVGGIANHILIRTYGQATAIFTIGFSLNAALVSRAIMRPRLIDGITDPILVHRSDNLLSVVLLGDSWTSPRWCAWSALPTPTLSRLRISLL